MPSAPGADAAEGAWGAVTSSVDWCEVNYEVSRHVAEFFNTASSLCMVGAGAAGLALHWAAPIEARFRFAFGLVAVLGMGSVVFHASLKWWGQMLDEVPMLWAALATTLIVLEDGPTPVWGPWLPRALVLHGALTSAAVALSAGSWQFYLFHASFGTTELYSLWGVWRIYRRRRDGAPAAGAAGAEAGGMAANGSSAEAPPRSRACDGVPDAAQATETGAALALYRRGIAAYVVGIACWQADLLQCAWLSETWPEVTGLPNPQLHAWWHALVSVGFYCLLVFTCFDRLLTLHGAAELRWVGGALPYATLPPRCPAAKAIKSS